MPSIDATKLSGVLLTYQRIVSSISIKTVYFCSSGFPFYSPELYSTSVNVMKIVYKSVASSLSSSS